MELPIQVTLAANAGVLLRVRNTSILIDALFADTSSCGPSPETRERLLCGLPPFDEVDYVLFTHLHQDHFSEDVTREFLNRVTGLLDYLIPHYQEEGKRRIVIAIGCTGGAHRSVAIAEAIGRHLTAAGLRVRTSHRDVDLEQARILRGEDE